MGKVLEFVAREKDNRLHLVSIDKKTGADVFDITEARKEMLNRDRREVKRTILTEFVGAFVVLPEKGLMKVVLADISENGLSFELDMQEGSFQGDEEVAMRVYLNHTTYFPFTVCITNSRSIDESALVRHGANFVKGTVNDVALHHFVKFIETVSASLKTDTGDIQVSHIS